MRLKTKKMKRKIAIISLFVLVLLMLFSIANADTKDRSEYFNIFNQTYEYNDMPTLKIEAFFDDIPELSKMIKEEYESLMAAVPQKFKTQLKESGVVVYVVKSTSKYFSKLSDTAPNGFYNPSNRQIFINTAYDEEYDRYDHAACRIEISLYHEIGHAVDDLNGIYSKDKEFRGILKEEAEINIMINNNPSEMFAEIFQNYMYDMCSITKGYIPLKSYSAHINVDKCPRCTAYIINALELDDIYDLNTQIKLFIIAVLSHISNNFKIYTLS